jgi:hypothetical protein
MVHFLGYNENPVITNKKIPKRPKIDNVCTIILSMLKKMLTIMTTQQIFGLILLSVVYFN